MATRSPFSLEGKTAIRTGGGPRHRQPPHAPGPRSFAMVVDVRQEEQVKAVVERAVQEFGRLDIMVNNAGASFRAKPEDISINGWNTVVGINLNGVFLGWQGAGKP